MSYVWDPGTSLGVTEIENKQVQLHIYPNPAKDHFVCSIENTELKNPKLELFNVLGEKVNAEASYNGHQIIVSTDNLSNGFYVIRIVDSEKAYTGKLLLQK